MCMVLGVGHNSFFLYTVYAFTRLFDVTVTKLRFMKLLLDCTI